MRISDWSSDVCSSDLLWMLQTRTGGPTILGVDVLWVATLLSGVAAFAVLLAIYAATTARDPMAKRAKALNDRREQFKAGITASTSKRRAKLVRHNQTTHRIRTFLSSLKVLQDSQVKPAPTQLVKAQQKTERK